jgi:DNA-binding transcriptional MerR regulator
MVRDSDGLLNVRQTARLLGVHENTVRNWEADGRLPAAKILPSGFRRFDPTVVTRFADELATSGDDNTRIYEIEELQDLCLIAITDGKQLPARAIAELPPWRAVMLARVAHKASIPIEGGTLEQLVDEARRVGGEGKLTWPPAEAS